MRSRSVLVAALLTGISGGHGPIAAGRPQIPDFSTTIDYSVIDEMPRSTSSESGPSAHPARTEQLSCRFELNGNGGIYDLGYQAWQRDPDRQQLAYKMFSHMGEGVGATLLAETVLGKYGDYECQVDWNVLPWGYIGTDIGRITVRPKCGDNNVEWSTLIDEYYTPSQFPGLTYKPLCDDTVISIYGNHFSWSDYMTDQTGDHSHDGYGIAKLGVYPDAADLIVALYDRGEVKMTSGFRCPAVNKRLNPNGSAPNSRHQWGSAIDLKSVSQPWNHDEWLLLYMAASEVGFSYFEPWGTGPGETTSHLHADRR